MRTVPPTEKGKYRAIASGAIANGKPVVVNSAGTVSVVSATAQSLGSEAEFTTSAANYINIVHDSSNNKNVVIYRNGDNSKGEARVGTVSGTSISYGTAVEFEQGNTEFIAATFDSNSNKVVIAYRDGGDSNYGKAIVGTVSGTDISFGSAVTFESAHAAYMSATFDSTNNKVVITYCDLGNSNYGTAIVGTVSGTSISFGTPVVYASAATYFQAVGFDTANGKVVINYDNITEVYISGGSNTGLGIVGTVSGTSISFGTRAGWMNGGQLYPDITYDSDSGKFLFVSANGGQSNRGEAVVATVSGTSISFGTVAVYETDVANYSQVVMDTSTNKAVVAFRDQGDSNKGKFNVGTISGTDVSFSGATEFNAATEWIGIEYDSTAEKVLIGYRDQGDGDDGTVRVLQNGFTNENLTTENFIGTSAHAAADGAKVLVNTQGAIDENQSGLTAGQTFFVDKNGALQLTTNITQGAGTPAVFASGSMIDGDILFDPDSGKMILAYYDSATNKGRYIVATISGTDVTFGTAGQIGSNEYVYYASLAYDTNSDRVVLFYMDDNNYAKAIVGTVSGTTISWGSPVTVLADSTAHHQAIFDPDTNKIVVAFRDQNQVASGNGAKAAVGTVDPSDNSISFGSLVAFDGGMVYSDIAYDTTNNKVVIAYSDEGNSSYGTAIVGTVSGTSISFGTAVVWRSDGANLTEMSFDSNESRVVIAHRGPNSPDNGRAIVGTVSGTSISFGSAADFDSSASTDIAIAFDSNVNKHLIIYRDVNNSNYFTGIIGTVSGTSISFGSSFLLNGNNVGRYGYVDFDTTQNKFLIGFRDEGDSNKAKAVVFQNANDLSGSLSHDAVTAGTALSATKLLVKG